MWKTLPIHGYYHFTIFLTSPNICHFSGPRNQVHCSPRWPWPSQVHPHTSSAWAFKGGKRSTHWSSLSFDGAWWGLQTSKFWGTQFWCSYSSIYFCITLNTSVLAESKACMCPQTTSIIFQRKYFDNFIFVLQLKLEYGLIDYWVCMEKMRVSQKAIINWKHYSLFLTFN